MRLSKIKGLFDLCVLVSACMWCPAPHARAATFAVSSPAEIQAVLDEARPGDEIVMRSGIWKDAVIEFRGMGTSEAPITLRAQTCGATILSGQSRMEILGKHLVVDGLVFKNGYLAGSAVVRFPQGRIVSEDCRLTNTSIVDYNPPRKSIKYFWVEISGARNRVDHCRFSGMNHEGVVIKINAGPQPGSHRIDHNYFGNRPRGIGNGYETIRIGTSDTSMFASRTVFEYNYFEKCDGEHAILSNKCCENVYRYNTFVDCAGLLTLRHGHRCLVEGNFFLGRGNVRMGGVRVIGEGHRIINNVFVDMKANPYYAAVTFMNGIPDSPLHGYDQVKDCVVAFNTFVNNRWNLNFGGNRETATLPPENCLVANNLFVGPDSGFVHYTSKPRNLVLQGNIAHQVDLDGDGPPGVRLVDPMLEKEDDVKWRPTPRSPALGAAVGDFPAVTHDVDGQPRSAPKAVGADEPSPDPCRNRPLTSRDVGPGSSCCSH